MYISNLVHRGLLSKLEEIIKEFDHNVIRITQDCVIKANDLRPV